MKIFMDIILNIRLDLDEAITYEDFVKAMQLAKKGLEAAKNRELLGEIEYFKGQIAYRTTRERHYHVAKAANILHKSISKTIDELIDAGLERLHLLS